MAYQPVADCEELTDLWLQGSCCGPEMRCHRLARSAPRSPEIDEHCDRGCSQGPVELISRAHVMRLAGKKRPATPAAFRRGAGNEPRCRCPVCHAAGCALDCLKPIHAHPPTVTCRESDARSVLGFALAGALAMTSARGLERRLASCRNLVLVRLNARTRLAVLVSLASTELGNVVVAGAGHWALTLLRKCSATRQRQSQCSAESYPDRHDCPPRPCR